LPFSAATTTPKGTEGELAGAAMTGVSITAKLRIAIKIAVHNMRTKTSTRACALRVGRRRDRVKHGNLFGRVKYTPLKGHKGEGEKVQRINRFRVVLALSWSRSGASTAHPGSIEVSPKFRF
jgi:hypothetical protein